MVSRVFRLIIVNIFVYISGKWNGLKRRVLPVKFANKPKNLAIRRGFSYLNSKYIWLGDNVHIGRDSMIFAIDRIQCASGEQNFTPKIEIGKGFYCAGRLQIYAFSDIVIEDDVLFAYNILLSDAYHTIDRVDIPYKDQGYSQISPIRVGRGCWIGQNVVFLPGVTVGEFCIVGANSVVNRSIPPYSIAVGAPARVVKTFDHQNQCWVRVDRKEPE
jgi:acetyltransferase-like isoleucine patch superfamily enzyme